MEGGSERQANMILSEMFDLQCIIEDIANIAEKSLTKKSEFVNAALL
jgi:hypothetical protein